MRYLYVCNATKDRIEKIELDNFEEVESIDIKDSEGEKLSPRGLCLYEDMLITSNYNNSSISFLYKEGTIEKFYLGGGCTEASVLDKYAYVICEDSNTVVCFDIKAKDVVEIIPCGSSPHSLDICKKSNRILISNMYSDNLSIIDVTKGGEVKNISVGAYPTKALWSSDGNYILVCESNLGYCGKGCVTIISLRNNSILHKIPVGNAPMDMYCDGRYCYVSNYGDGSISIVDINKYEEIKKVRIGGMVKAITTDEKYIYVGDIYNNSLIRVNKIDESKKVIPMSGEPMGMIVN
ncbi:YncE family protein [Clostridium sp. Marseille-QA1073]